MSYLSNCLGPLQAAILAATENAEYVNMQHILNAYDRLVLGNIY